MRTIRDETKAGLISPGLGKPCHTRLRKLSPEKKLRLFLTENLDAIIMHHYAASKTISLHCESLCLPLNRKLEYKVARLFYNFFRY